MSRLSTKAAGRILGCCVCAIYTDGMRFKFYKHIFPGQCCGIKKSVPGLLFGILQNGCSLVKFLVGILMININVISLNINYMCLW